MVSGQKFLGRYQGSSKWFWNGHYPKKLRRCHGKSTPRLLDQVRSFIRLHHYSIHTERTYLDCERVVNGSDRRLVLPRVESRRHKNRNIETLAPLSPCWTGYLRQRFLHPSLPSRPSVTISRLAGPEFRSDHLLNSLASRSQTKAGQPRFRVQGSMFRNSQLSTFNSPTIKPSLTTLSVQGSAYSVHC